MASKGKERPFYMYLAYGLFFELLIVFLFIPESWVLSIGESDRALTAWVFGQEYELSILTMTSDVYTKVMIDTGVIETVNNFLFEQWDNTPTPDGVQEFTFDDRGMSQYVENRVKITWSALYIAFYRLCETWTWLPYMLPVLIPGMMDGIVNRQVNQWRFFSPSPLLHTVALNSMRFGGALLILFPFLPTPFPVVFIPLILFVIVWMSSMFMGNLSKHL